MADSFCLFVVRGCFIVLPMISWKLFISKVKIFKSISKVIFLKRTVTDVCSLILSGECCSNWTTPMTHKNKYNKGYCIREFIKQEKSNMNLRRSSITRNIALKEITFIRNASYSLADINIWTYSKRSSYVPLYGCLWKLLAKSWTCGS